MKLQDVFLKYPLINIPSALLDEVAIAISPVDAYVTSASVAVHPLPAFK